MRIRRLELAGIGPFAGTYAIDFDALTAGGLFLLDGPTGSGKSTIIDAITWGLYGTVAGGRDSTDDRMRSTHAAASAQSYVDLVFSVEAGTFRVRRTPQWTKPGNKNPTNATAKLWRLSESAVEKGEFEAGEVVETRAAGASIEIARLVGLSREQFVQTIVLPQGKFADFLRLRSSDRTELLEQIFDTGLYRRVAEELSRRAREAEAAVASARQAWLASVAAYLAALELDSEDGGAIEQAADAAASPQEAHEVTGDLDRLLERCQEEADRAETSRANRLAAASQASERMRAAAELHGRLARRSALIFRRERLDAQEESVEDSRAKLGLHEAAAPLLAYLDSCDRAELHVRSAQSRVADLGVDPSAVTAEALAAMSAGVEELGSLGGRLEELLRLEESLAERLEEQRERQNRLDALLESISAAEEAEARLPEQQADLERRIAEAQAAAATIEARESEVARCKALLDRVGERSRLRADREGAHAAVAEAAASFARSRQFRDGVMASWLASTAAILASDLVDSEPCPVCGSREHPAPAPASQVRATKEEADAADAAAAAARDALDEAQRNLASIDVRLGEVSRGIEGLDEDEASGRFEEAELALTEARRAHEALTGLRAELSNAKERLVQAEERRNRDGEARANLEAETRSASRAIAATRARIEPELDGYASIADRRRALAASLDRARERLEASRALLTAQASLREREEERADALRASRFANPDEVRAAFCPAEAQRLCDAIDAYEQELRDVVRDLAQPEIAELTGEEDPRLEESAVAADEAEAAAAQAQRAATLLADRVERSRRARNSVAERTSAWQEARRLAAPIQRLANLAIAGGESVTRVPLATFVVQRRFEQVVDRANERLADISLGRYRLERTDERERGSRESKTGLGLVVVDRDGEAAGSATRSTRSLSGGETFYVSLSLALALADVVRAENGGIAIDTLLVDEGFGSLDENTLALVMSTLTGLAKNGRSVGLVSHVAEMKKLVAEQINVRPLPDGSSRLDVKC